MHLFKKLKKKVLSFLTISTISTLSYNILTPKFTLQNVHFYHHQP